ncbi:acyl-CoA Delta(11) desaturase-like [Copidosoma floridanum]|uniref:acyl-CoA Delta(11) desaturase-like n=1 Tax=Copidosoma floridanum TaxID=29053 RepID=UPI0006C93C8A|nr:acyl-CoA Delta(11) desaturase-like [Copidosoma floridanum]
MPGIIEKWDEQVIVEDNHSNAIETEINKNTNRIKVIDETPNAEAGKTKNRKEKFGFFKEIHWTRALAVGWYNIFGLYILFTFPYLQKWRTTMWALLMANLSIFGITAGIHRLWSHKAYKAKAPLRIVLAFSYMIPFKKWILYHRLHHKYTDTDADPHNSTRGFFFSHVGWLMAKRNPAVIEKMKTIDLSDIKADPIVSFCNKYFYYFVLVIWYITTAVPVYGWNEDWYSSFLSQYLRFVYALNVSCCVNSFAHMFGYKPYNSTITATEHALTSYMALGEGWHNYHHVFPFDYRTPELMFDVTAHVLHFFQKMGWAYDMRITKESVIIATMKRKGDGSYLNAVMS